MISYDSLRLYWILDGKMIYLPVFIFNYSHYVISLLQQLQRNKGNILKTPFLMTAAPRISMEAAIRSFQDHLVSGSQRFSRPRLPARAVDFTSMEPQ